MNCIKLIFFLLVATFLNGQEYNGTISSITSYSFDDDDVPRSLKIISDLNSIPISDLDTMYTYVTICADTLISFTTSKSGVPISNQLQIGENRYLDDGQEYFKYAFLPHPVELYEVDDFKKKKSTKEFDYYLKTDKYKGYPAYADIDESLNFSKSASLKGAYSNYFSPIGVYSSYKSVAFKSLSVYSYEQGENSCSLPEFGITLSNKREESFSFDDDERESFNNTDLMSPLQLPSHLLTDFKGDVRYLNDYIGEHFTIIDFCASWCKPCLAELEFLKEVYDDYSKKGIGVVSISIDSNTDYLVAQKLIGSNTEWPLLFLDGGKEAGLMREFQINSIPRFILLNSDGDIVNINCPKPSNENFIALLENALLSR